MELEDDDVETSTEYELESIKAGTHRTTPSSCTVVRLWSTSHLVSRGVTWRSPRSKRNIGGV